MSVRKLRRNSLLIALLASGCAIAIPPPREPVSEDARHAIALLSTRWHAFSDFRTLADIQLERGGEKQRLSGALLVKAPASVRFEALSPFGQPVLIVTIHEGRLTAYNVVAREAVVAPATVDTAVRFLNLPVDADDLVSVLAGRAVPPKDLRVAELLPPDQDGPSLNLIGRIHRQRGWMDFETGVVRQLNITGGRAEARITYHREPDGSLSGFALSAGQSSVTGLVSYRNVIVDGGIEPERFQFTIPEGATIERLR